jgi:hypothetical protein
MDFLPYTDPVDSTKMHQMWACLQIVSVKYPRAGCAVGIEWVEEVSEMGGIQVNPHGEGGICVEP